MGFEFKTLLVTGAAGFIGFYLAKRLLEDGFHVVGIDNLNDYYDVNLKKDRLNLLKKNSRFTFYQTDISDLDGLTTIFKTRQVDVVVNLAAQAGVRYSLENPHAYVNSNIVGFVNILECCRHHHVKHLVFASSSSVYGANTKMPFSVHDNVDHPVSLYAATKKSNELMAHTYSHLYDLPCTGLRFFTVYGPWGRPDMALFLFTKAILNNEPIKVFNYGKMKRDFTYIDDIVEGVVRVMKLLPKPNPNWSGDAPDPGTSYKPYLIYNIGNNNPVELTEFIEAIENALGQKADRELMDIQPGDVAETYANIDDLYNSVGFKPETSIEEGIGKFIEWYKSYYQV
ncbi:MAG: NAD-dependent epimerase [Dissulfuribacterales bacterium]